MHYSLTTAWSLSDCLKCSNLFDVRHPVLIESVALVIGQIEHGLLLCTSYKVLSLLSSSWVELLSAAWQMHLCPLSTFTICCTSLRMSQTSRHTLNWCAVSFLSYFKRYCAPAMARLAHLHSAEHHLVLQVWLINCLSCLQAHYPWLHRSISTCNRKIRCSIPQVS